MSTPVKRGLPQPCVPSAAEMQLSQVQPAPPGLFLASLSRLTGPENHTVLEQKENRRKQKPSRPPQLSQEESSQPRVPRPPRLRGFHDSTALLCDPTGGPCSLCEETKLPEDKDQRVARTTPPLGSHGSPDAAAFAPAAGWLFRAGTRIVWASVPSREDE